MLCSTYNEMMVHLDAIVDLLDSRVRTETYAELVCQIRILDSALTMKDFIYKALKVCK